MVKSIQVFVDDELYNELVKMKGKGSWVEFLKGLTIRDKIIGDEDGPINQV